QNRAALVRAALTLIRAWVCAGRPLGEQTIGMFEAWAKVMGGILEVATVKGFLDNLKEFYDAADQEGNAWRGFIASWWHKFHDDTKGVSDVFHLADELDFGKASNEKAQKIRLGIMLGQARDRVYSVEEAGHMVQVRVTFVGTVDRAAQWKLVETGR